MRVQFSGVTYQPNRPTFQGLSPQYQLLNLQDQLELQLAKSSDSSEKISLRQQIAEVEEASKREETATAYLQKLKQQQQPASPLDENQLRVKLNDLRNAYVLATGVNASQAFSLSSQIKELEQQLGIQHPPVVSRPSSQPFVSQPPAPPQQVTFNPPTGYVPYSTPEYDKIVKPTINDVFNTERSKIEFLEEELSQKEKGSHPFFQALSEIKQTQESLYKKSQHKEDLKALIQSTEELIPLVKNYADTNYQGLGHIHQRTHNKLVEALKEYKAKL